MHRCIAILFTRFVSRYSYQESRYLVQLYYWLKYMNTNLLLSIQFIV